MNPLPRGRHVECQCRQLVSANVNINGTLFHLGRDSNRPKAPKLRRFTLRVQYGPPIRDQNRLSGLETKGLLSPVRD